MTAKKAYFFLLSLIALWALIMGVALATRPFLPIDETRYLAVAWEMWRDGNFLVPHLNGNVYSQKPPLMFWLIDLGWRAFGVNNTWPRLVAPLFGLAALFLTRNLARRLWPDYPAISDFAPVLLFGSLFWTLFTTLTMFDMILAFFALIGLIGVLQAWRGERWGIILMGIGIGFGVLTKGPVILVHILPAALLAPFWGGKSGKGDFSLKEWYLGVLKGFGLGVAIGLAWAVPAAISGGGVYAKAIFWGQSAGRMASSFAHARPWWWYLAILPGLILPWVIWPALWRGLGKRIRNGMLKDFGVGFCLAWFLPALILFSAFSGKQIHYLLPELPALALLMAFGLAAKTHQADSQAETSPKTPASTRGLLIPGLGFSLLGALVIALPVLPLGPKVAAAAAGIAPFWGLLPLGLGLAAAWRPPKAMSSRLLLLAALTAVLVVSVHLSLRPLLATNYDLAPLAKRLQTWEAEGRPLANSGKYQGQFDFLGRLKKPIAILGEKNVKAWAEANPRGEVISYHYKLPADITPDYAQPYRGKYIAVWNAKTVIEHPYLALRRDKPLP
jgi:hypothetical protein